MVADPTLPTQRPVSKEVQFMMTCLCDAFYADVAKASIEVLEHAGCTVDVPRDQTCCGQPAFNGGDFEHSRRIAQHTAEVFAGNQPVIVPSGSCAAMHFHGHRLQFENEPPCEPVTSLAGRTWELFDFLVNGLGFTTWPGRLAQRVALHHSCHTRSTATGAAMLTLLGSIEGLELVEFGQGEQCCGFGGTFSVTFPHISEGMGNLKLDHIHSAQPDVLVSGDMSCLMHLHGLAERQNKPPLPHRHAVELLIASLAEPVPA